MLQPLKPLPHFCNSQPLRRTRACLLARSVNSLGNVKQDVDHDVSMEEVTSLIRADAEVLNVRRLGDSKAIRRPRNLAEINRRHHAISCTWCFLTLILHSMLFRMTPLFYTTGVAVFAVAFDIFCY